MFPSRHVACFLNPIERNQGFPLHHVQEIKLMQEADKSQFTRVHGNALTWFTPHVDPFGVTDCIC